MNEIQRILDKLVYYRIIIGNGNYEDILDLKKEASINIIDLIESLERLNSKNIITWDKNNSKIYAN